jgi:hypothetical protein
MSSRAALLCCVLAVVSPAQKPSAPPAAPSGSAPKTVQELDAQVTKLLVAFARTAESSKLPSRARTAYEQILDHYDGDNAAARAGLGWKKVKGEWQQVTPLDKLPADAANDAQKKTVDAAWDAARKRIGAMHRDLGTALAAAGDARSPYQFERALVFVPDDRAAHVALGHEELDGFFGTADQLAFVRRMRAIFAKAREIAAAPVEVEPVATAFLPPELKPAGFAFAGAKGPNVTYWVVGSTEEAVAHATWNHRARLLLEFLLGDGGRRYLTPQTARWVAVVRDESQKEHLLRTCPGAGGGEPYERAVLFGGGSFKLGNSYGEWSQHPSEHDADAAVAQLTKRGTRSFNNALSEGLVHAMTWLLCGTTETGYMQLGTAAGTKEDTSRDPVEWLARLRTAVDAGNDWPLAQIPREQMNNFRPAVRTKVWTFVVWLMARYPDSWGALLAKIGHGPRLPEEIDAMFVEVLGVGAGQADAEWRAWLRRGSPIGKASGLPQ